VAAIIIAIFVISTFAVVNPVNAHFTLGDLTGSYRFHKLDFDPHVPGVIGYVWPGGGQNAYQGVPNFAATTSAPGYQSPYPCRAAGEQLGGGSIGTVATPQCLPAGAPTSSWYQLQGSAYAPFGAVLAGSTGDLIFAINSTSTRNSRGWSALMIAIPPEFGVPDISQITSTLTNNYASIYVDRLSPWDRYAPGWTLITVFADTDCSAGKFQVTCNSNSAQGAGYYNHQFINFTSEDEWYYVRINGVQAPWIAGRYFFKMLLYGDNDIVGMAFRGENTTQFVPPQNWPVLLVKGEIDPGIITGTIRYGGYNSTLYGQPIGESGMVLAKMQVRLDPYTGEQRPDLPTINARGFFNATANGHYEVEGVAPGIYDIYAEAAGFPQQLIESSVTILKGQSLHFDGYVQPGPVIHGNVFTKHQFGDEPWMGETLNVNGQCIYQQGSSTLGCYNEYIKIELYGGATLNHIPDASAGLVSWSPLPCVAGGQALFYDRRHAGLCGDPRLGSQIAFPWHEYSTVCAGTFPNTQNPVCPYGGQVSIQSPAGLFHGATNGYVNDTSETYALGLRTSDPQGVGPPQNWFVQGGTTTPFHFEFGVKGEYGAPRDLSGMVPQVYSTWINGLTPGRYFVRAWVFRYVQSALDGSTFQEYYFDVTPQEWAGDVTLPIDLRLSSWINKTVHFHNQAGSLIEDPIDTGAAFMSGYLAGADGHIYSYNQSALGFNSFGHSGYFTGYATGGGGGAWLLSSGIQTISSAKTNTCYGGEGAPANSIRYHNSFVAGGLSNQATCGTDLDKAKLNLIAINTGRANIQFWGINDTWSGENYGIPSGTYSAYVFALGYLPQGPPEQVSVTLSGTPTSISDHLIRGVGFNVTLYSVDWERPTVNRAWVWGNRVGYSKSNYPDRATFGTAACFGAGCPTSFKPFPNAPVGAEIDVGIYSNGTLAGYMSDESSGQNGQLPSTVTTLSLFQDQIENNVTATGGGWDPVNALGQIFPQDSNSSYFGQELKRPGFLGGYGKGRFVFNTQARLWTDSLWVNSPAGTPANPFGIPLFPNLYQTIPTAFPAGQYDLRGFTYGYVQDEPFSVFSGLAQTADVRLNLVIGVNVTLDILFKKEHVITPTASNMSGRVRLFDDSGNLVAEWMSSEGVYIPPNNGAPANGVAQNGRAVAANGQTQFPFGSLHSVVPKPLPLNEYNFIPGGITLLHVLLSGLPQVPAVGTGAPDGKAALYFGDPIIPVTTRQCSFEVDCYKNPGISWSASGFFPNSGILGYPDYQGGWTAEVDLVNWYNNNSATPEAGNSYHGTYIALTNPAQTSSSCQPQPLGTCTIFKNFAQYYFPVNGLLEGESFHIIPGTTATSGISLAEDLALGPWGFGHSMVPNHLGPYSQEGVWQVSGAHLSGEASGIFELDLNGFISGTALAFTWANDFRPLSWATVSVTGANGATWNYYSYDGQYDMFLIPGAYSFTITSPGIASQTLSIAVTGGESSTATNVYLQQSNIPVPEFSGIAVVVFSALAASLYLLQRRRRE